MSNTSTCNSLVTNKLLNASLYRVKQMGSANEIFIYDSDVCMIINLNKKTNYSVIKVIDLTNSNKDKTSGNTNKPSD